MKQFLSHKTPVYAGGDVLDHLTENLNKYRRIFFLADFRTLRKCLPLVETLMGEEKECHTLVIQEGERFKNINTCMLLWKQLQQLHARRDDLLVNVGGGVVCDIGAFVGSTFKRGIPFIQVPTSLMAMADAAIGGKSGVDLEMIKNQVGTFSHPQSIYIYPPFIETLDQRQVMNGCAEIIKHALINDVKLWNDIIKEDAAPSSEEYILRSAELKAAIIGFDFEESGNRRILNFGHTIGHALESYSLRHDSHPLLHGEALAMGLICEAWLSMHLNGLSSSDFEKIKKYILKFYPKYTLRSSAIQEVIALTLHDKKNDDDRINVSLLKEIGVCTYNNYCSPDDIMTALNVYYDLKNG
jgi:3-dehydroquinate synthase